jgi:hypothetical protein
VLVATRTSFDRSNDNQTITFEDHSKISCEKFTIRGHGKISHQRDGSLLGFEDRTEVLGDPDGSVLGVAVGALLGTLEGMLLSASAGLQLGALDGA